jgi:hypothetical protein
MVDMGGLPFVVKVLTASVKRCGIAKKTDVAEHPKVFRHVGLLVNRLPGWVALYLVIQRRLERPKVFPPQTPRLYCLSRGKQIDVALENGQKHSFGIIRGGRMEQFVGKRTTFNATWMRYQHLRKLD